MTMLSANIRRLLHDVAHHSDNPDLRLAERARTILAGMHKPFLSSKTVRKPIPSVSRRKTIRNYENGIKKQSDGSEKCMTKASWQKRVDELFERDKIDDEQSPQYWRCALCKRPSEFYGNFDPDHIRKRSVGRDDQLRNLQLLGNANLCNCHGKKHDEFKKRGAGQ